MGRSRKRRRRKTLESSCLSKIKYTQLESSIEAERLWNDRRLVIYTYHCNICEGYHLTSQSPKENRRFSKRNKIVSGPITEIVHKELDKIGNKIKIDQ